MSALAVSFKNISGLVRSDRPLSNDQILQAAPSVWLYRLKRSMTPWKA